MEDQRFELFFDTLYTLIPLLKRHFFLGHDAIECGSVTNAHFPLLFMLYSHGTTTMTEAAKAVGLSKPHMTLQVDRLVEEGLIERFPDSEDRRLIAIRLTEKGSGFVLRLKDLMKEKAWNMFSSLSDETLEKTLNALLTLKEGLGGPENDSRRQTKTAKHAQDGYR